MGIYSPDGDVDLHGAEEVNLRNSSGVELLGQKTSAASLPIVIASDQSAIPVTGIITVGTVTADQGTPASVAHSWPITVTNGVYTLLVNTDGSLNVNLISSPSAPPSASTISQFVAQNKVYSFSADLNMASSSLNNPLILLNNPVNSGKTIYLYKVIFGINVTNVLAEFKLFANPTVTTNGTAITPVNTNIGNSAPASVLQAFSLSTVSNPGANLESITISQNNSAFGVLEDFSIFIQPGNKFLLTGNPGSNNREAAVTVVWVEV